MARPLHDPGFVRKLCLLCCHSVRNIAYYRAGYVSEDGRGELKHPTEFGATVNSDMLDIAVLEWCKLFAEVKGKHHWKRFVRDELEQQKFLADLWTTAALNRQGWDRYLDKMRVYRDKFVAHLDELNVMDIPPLDVTLEASFFLYGYVRDHTAPDVFEVGRCRYLPGDMRAYYAKCHDDASAAYVKLISQ